MATWIAQQNCTALFSSGVDLWYVMLVALTFYIQSMLHKQVIKTRKTLLIVDNYHAISTYQIVGLFLPRRFLLVFC